MDIDNFELKETMVDTFDLLAGTLKTYQPELKAREVGTVTYVGPDIVRVTGLHGVKSEELIRFPGDCLGWAFNVDQTETGVVLIDESKALKAGSEVRRTGRVLDVPVGKDLLGRVIDARGRPLDDMGAIRTSEWRPVERAAPAIMDRAPVTIPLQTGLKLIDALIPIGRGQRELILGDRQTGKTAIAVDTIINQADKDVICIYCAIGKRYSATAKVIADLREHQAMDYCIVIANTEEDPPGLEFICPYAAMTMGEYFMEQGADVLIVFDDLTRHARAYREMSLLLRRPPGREAYPGDIFYVHSRLLERSTHLREEFGGGSLSVLPIIETEAQNLSAYIPTNLISITDGQIYLSPDLFQKGNLPAVDIGKSVSRVGGKTQLPAYRMVSGDLRLSYSQFEELETFSRFGTRLDEETQKSLKRGRRVREILKQPQYEPVPVPEQIAVLVAVNEGVFDKLPLEEIAEGEEKIRETVTEDLPDVCKKIEQGEKLTDTDLDSLRKVAEDSLYLRDQENRDANN